MNCNFSIHEGIRDTGEVISPFCDDQMDDDVKRDDFCCFEQALIKDNGKLVCKICGKVDSYGTIDEYVDFYENRYRIRRKSIYNRKYHIENILNHLKYTNGIEIDCKNRQKIHDIFKQIDKVLSQVNGNRKRMINTNFILIQLFKMLNLPHDNISITKSKKTLRFYERYWGYIMSFYVIDR